MIVMEMNFCRKHVRTCHFVFICDSASWTWRRKFSTTNGQCTVFCVTRLTWPNLAESRLNGELLDCNVCPTVATQVDASCFTSLTFCSFSAHSHQQTEAFAYCTWSYCVFSSVNTCKRQFLSLTSCMHACTVCACACVLSSSVLDPRLRSLLLMTSDV